MEERSETESWKRLIETFKDRPELLAEASEAMKGYAGAVHEMGHEFIEYESQEEGLSCTMLTHFLLGILRLGYLRARVGSTEDDGIPGIEKGCREGDRILSHNELEKLLKGIDF